MSRARRSCAYIVIHPRGRGQTQTAAGGRQEKAMSWTRHYRVIQGYTAVRA